MFSELQKRRVELFATLYVVALFFPFLVNIFSNEWTVFATMLIMPAASIAYFFAYRRVALGVRKSDRFCVTWGSSAYFPQVLFKVSLFFTVIMLWLLISSVHKVVLN